MYYFLNIYFVSYVTINQFIIVPDSGNGQVLVWYECYDLPLQVIRYKDTTRPPSPPG